MMKEMNISMDSGVGEGIDSQGVGAGGSIGCGGIGREEEWI